MSVDTSLVGVGLYDVAEAARLTGVSRQRIRRWLCGYRYTYQDEKRWSTPLWRPQLPAFDGKLALGFRDLTEIRVVDALVTAGLSPRTVRRAICHAREYIDDERPLSTAKFRTDGRTIFLEIADETKEPALFDLLKRQYGLHRVLAPSFKDLEFDENVAVRWWPLSRQRQVVIDPARSFGQPIVAGGGVPTAALADAVDTEGSVAAAARLFEVSPDAVRDALRFEQRLAA